MAVKKKSRPPAKKTVVKKTSVFKYLFNKDTLFATILVFMVMGLFVGMERGLGFFDPKEIASKDFDYNDLAFNLLSNHKNIPVDTGIYVVDISRYKRKVIDSIIKNVEKAHPKVIGVDVLFDHPDTADQASDSSLSNIFHTDKRIVMAYLLDSAKNKTRNYFANNITGRKGFVNFTMERQDVIRVFDPYTIEADTDLAFSTAIVKAAEPKAYDDMLARHNLPEVINYTRDNSKFIIIKGKSDSAAMSVLNNKIVLIGAIAHGYNYEDKLFTPLNSKFAGKSMPDLSGILVQANIIRMMLDGNYIHHWKTWQSLAFAFIICWLHMAFFISYFLEKHVWFHVASKIAQLVSSFVFIYVGLFLCYCLNMQIDMTQTIIAIILAVDLLYFYEAGVLWLHHHKKYDTIFHHEYPN